MFEEQLLIVALTRQVILFVDALDEAGEETARTLAEYFNDLTVQFKEQNASLKICISARHYPILIRTVSKDVWVEEENGHDIQTVVRQQLDKVKILSAENDKLLCDEISNRAKGIFQWAWLTIRLVIGLLNRGESLNTVKKRLNAVPTELGNVYEHILKNVILPVDVPRVLLLNQWILFAITSLSLKELHWATAFDSDIPSSCPKFKDERFNDDITDNAALLNSLSGGLIECEPQGRVVQLIHESAREYMRDKGLKYLFQEFRKGGGELRHYEGDDGNIVAASHARLARACIACLKKSCLLIPERPERDENWEPANHFPGHMTTWVVSSSNPKEPYLPFLSYSERFWFRHSRHAEVAGTVDQKLDKQFWFNSREGTLIFTKWAERIRLNQSRLTFRILYQDFLDVQSNENLLETISLLIKHGICFQGLKKYPDGAENWELRNWEPIHHAASWGHLELVKALTEISKCANTQTFYKGHTPADIAAIYGHREVLRALLQERSQYEYPKSSRVTCNITSLDSIIDYMMDYGKEVPRSNEDGNEEDPIKFSKIDTAIRRAARDGNSKMVEQLLDWGFHPDVHGGVCGSALSDVADTQGDAGLDIVQLLLDYGSDPVFLFGHCGVCYCHPETGKGEFVQKGRCRTWVEVSPGQCPTPFSRAVSNGDRCEALVAKIVEHVKSHKSSDRADGCNDTLRHSAVRKSLPATKVIALLIKDMWSDVTSFTTCSYEQVKSEDSPLLAENYYQTVLQASVGVGDAGIDNVKLLIKHGAQVNCRIPREYIEHPYFNGPVDPDASYSVRDLGCNNEFLWTEKEFDNQLKKTTSQEKDQGRDWSKDVVWGRTALTRAASLGDKAKEIVRFLLSKRADPHLRRMKDCLTPLQIAEGLPGDNTEVIKMLHEAMVAPKYFIDDSDESEGFARRVTMMTGTGKFIPRKKKKKTTETIDNGKFCFRDDSDESEDC